MLSSKFVRLSDICSSIDKAIVALQSLADMRGSYIADQGIRIDEIIAWQIVKVGPYTYTVVVEIKITTHLEYMNEISGATNG